MRGFRALPIAVALATAASAAFVAPAAAFHSGGVAACSGCHTMHASQDGRTPDGVAPGGHPDLLRAGSASDTCLRCHASRGQLAGGAGFGPGGDFHWLTRSFTWTGPGGSAAGSAGHTHGHSIIAPAAGLAADAVLATAPGGSFLSARLGCTSCHDPHGNGSFRMLYGRALGPAYGDGARFAFTADAPVARGLDGTTVPGGAAVETDASHTVYIGGMADWCANCHPALHAGNAQGFQHPVDLPLGAGMAAAYNAYVSTADPRGGDAATAYLGLVPFEAVDVDPLSVDPSQRTAGPGASDRVMCLTCHRAHASPFADAGRWDFRATRLDLDSHPRAGDGGATAQDVANRYYGYAIAAGQRSLCNKCHVKDDGDGPPSAPWPGRRGPWPDNPVGP